jgi:O-acetyl-ADP-ribose deacetylase (regulator of RNase III)
MPTSWNHESIRLLAGDGDPVVAVRDKARRLVAKAMDRGWTGPPFDPETLATDYLKLELVATDDVRDARTVPTKSGARIEFNPNRPRERRRYSIAHEIAHTLFPDYRDRVRNRGSHHADLHPRDWQLETLCNIAAAEILMPIGSLQATDSSAFTIDVLAHTRPKFDVSMEAVLIRAVQVSNFPCAVFAASRIETGVNVGRYRIQYGITSNNGPAIKRGALLPADSAVAECTAIGFTAKGNEAWTKELGRLRVECVGIPAFPGASYPRVAGILRPMSELNARPGIEFLSGNVLEPRGVGKKLMVHVVNDATPNWGGKGVAAAVRNRWPGAQRDFQAWASRSGSNLKLGQVHFFEIDSALALASIVAQHGYGESATPRIRYSALEGALQHVAAYAAKRAASIHMPRIGTGYGGGVWPVIQEIVTGTLLETGLPVTVYDLPNARPRQQPDLPL